MKKTISMILAILIFVGMIPFGTLEVSAADKAEISVESVSATADSTVELAVSITGNPGIASMGIILSFDSSLTLTEAQNGEAFSDLTLTLPPQLKKDGAVTESCRFAWLGSDNVTNDGVILKLKFRVSADAQVNTDCIVSVVCESAFNEQREPVQLSAAVGSVKVINYIPGDVDGNGVINMLDVLTLCQYYVDGCRYNPNGYAIDINPLSGDVDGNGIINMLDVLMICQYYVDGCTTNPNGYNVTLVPGKVICSHDLQYTSEKAATCTENGNIAYWMCSLCGEYFSDETATDEISLTNTMIPANGHTEVVDEAVAPTYDATGLTEGSHCSVCNTVLVEQQIVPKLEAKYHSITYKNIKTADSPTETRYAEHTGLLDLPKISVPGYKFLGWYTGSVGGTLVDYIPAGDTKDYVLFARWELITYTITYKEAAVHKNATSYTIEDRIVLENPEWSGLMFVNWTDENDHTVYVIEKGTTGDIVLTANWKSYRNNVVPAQNSTLMSAYRDDMGLYYFAYKLGTIENVVISSITDSYNKTTTAGQNLALTNTMSTSETDMSTIARTVNQSTTSTRSFTDTTTWAASKSKTKNFNNTFTVEAKIPIKKIWNLEIKDSAQYGITWGGTETNGTTTVEGESESMVTGNTLSTSSTISYAKTMSMTESRTINIPGEMPNGLYEYVYTTDIIVYGVVIYDPNSGNYHMSTYSALGDLSTTLMYYKQPSDKYNYPCDELPYHVDTESIEKIVKASYYVQYDENGGNGFMPTSIHAVGSQSGLAANTLTMDGYAFGGWELRSDNQNVIFSDKQNIIDLAAGGETVTLTARWTVDPNKIGKYVENGTVVSDSDGGKTYIVYNDITQTPQSTAAGYIHIIDWSSCIGTVDYISAVKQSDGTRYGGGNFNHDFANVDEVYFIGNPDAVYTNMIIYHVNYSQYSTVPTIHFVDFNISDSALRVYTADNMVSPHKSMIFDVEGKCSIKARPGENAISGFDTITYTGSGTLDVYGGNGADATNAGGNGTDGGCGIVVDHIIVDMAGGNLNIYGGNGGNGMKGADGETGKKGNDNSSDGNGEAGKAGNKGGNGGTGGAGGNGNNGYDGTNGKGGNGGAGGKGGKGGKAGAAITGSSIDRSGTLTANNGVCGTGGNGGNGGTGGKGGKEDVYAIKNVTSGNGGNGGKAGDGGDAYDLNHVGNPGDAGAAGKGGDKGSGGAQPGKSGKPGEAGSKGNVLA